MALPDPNRLHDLSTVYLDFKIILDLIKNGYQFNDENAPAVLTQLEKALAMLQKEIKSLENRDQPKSIDK